MAPHAASYPLLGRVSPPLHGQHYPPPGQQRFADLTRSEREVVELMAAGFRNREIALLTYKSEKTIEKYVGRVFTKLGLVGELQYRFDRRVLTARLYLVEAMSRGDLLLLSGSCADPFRPLGLRTEHPVPPATPKPPCTESQS